MAVTSQRSKRLSARLAQTAATALIAAVLGVALPATTAFGQTQDYTSCLDQAIKAPAKTREAAKRWGALGGGDQARHCAAIALIHLGSERLAAEELTRLGSDPGGLGVEDRFGALMLAGDLWLRNDRPKLAHASFQRADVLVPNSLVADVGLARVAADQQNWPAAISHLNKVITEAPTNPEALTLRAAALRRSGDPKAALRDAVSAVQFAPGAALAWFERGAAEMALGARDSAELSWLRAAELDPEGVPGDMARVNLQKLVLAQ
ncbi:MAG: hypothetical protein KTR21_08180 [Rhodobacteraceae bacterium]|nr:hypothetical protein [Paracoccaceae bacterium]